MEACIYCKKQIFNDDAIIREAITKDKPKNLYHINCWKERVENYKHILSPYSLKKNNKKWFMITLTTLASIFIIQIITIIVIIFLNS